MKKISLTKGTSAIVDNDDYEEVSKFKWCLNNNYAGRRVTIGYRKSIIVYMHSFINNTPPGFDTDHINCNKLDNRKKNLRACVRSENIRNAGPRKDSKSGVRCVRYRNDHFRSKPWELRVKINGKEVRKSFETEEQAVSDYKEFYDPRRIHNS